MTTLAGPQQVLPTYQVPVVIETADSHPLHKYKCVSWTWGENIHVLYCIFTVMNLGCY